jgi:hypothetical protein
LSIGRPNTEPREPNAVPAEEADDVERAFIEEITPAIRAYAEGEAISFTFGQRGFSVGLPTEPDGAFSANVNLEEGFFREQNFDPGMATFAITHEVEHLREWLKLIRTPEGARAWREHIRNLDSDPRLGALDNMVDDVRMNRTVVQRAPALRSSGERVYTQYAFPDPDLRVLTTGQPKPLHLQFAESLLRDAMLPQEEAATETEVCEAKAAILERVNRERSQRGLPAARSFNDVVRQISDPALSPMARLALTRRYLEPAYKALYAEDLDRETEQREGEGGAGQPDASNGDGGASDQPGEGAGTKPSAAPPKNAQPPNAPKSPGGPKGDTTSADPQAGTKPQQGQGGQGNNPAPGDASPEPQPGGEGAASNANEGASTTPPKDGAGAASPAASNEGKVPENGGDGTPGTPEAPDPRGSFAKRIRDIVDGKPDPAREGKPSKPSPVPGTPDLSALRPEEVFPDAYAEHAQHRPTPISREEWKKIAAELEKKVAKGLKPLDPNDPRVQERRRFFEEFAADHPTEKDWKNYQQWHKLREAAYNVRDANGHLVIDELREIFANILSHRRRKRPAPKAPQEEGEALSDAHIVEAWLSLKQGAEGAEVWTTERTRERLADLLGLFDITLVGDLSESMLHGGKAKAQQQTVVLLLAALEEFRAELAFAAGDLRDDLAVRTEAWGFGNAAHPLKPLSPRLEPIHCARVIGGLVPNAQYGTCDYLALREIRESIEADPEYAAKLKPRNGRTAPEIRRIVLVTTDGESNDVAACMEEVAKLRALGVKVVAIGVTAAGQSAETTYAPDGRVCEQAGDLARTAGFLLADLLKDPELGYGE